MHTLHFLLLKANSAKQAGAASQDLLLDWGNENNWRSIGGIASEDGSDDIENLDGGRWGLSYLDEQEGVPKDGTYFSRAAAFLHREIAPPVILTSAHPDFASALNELSGRLSRFDADHGHTNDLWAIGRDLKHLSELIDSRRARKHGEQIPQFYDWQFDHFGLTDLTEQSDGARRYLVFLDMHS